MPVASAQVKSALLLAGLYTKGTTTIVEPLKTRDHTERMLAAYKANIKVRGTRVRIKGSCVLVSPGKFDVPGDISSASFFIVGALITTGSRITLTRVSLNPGRIGILKVLKRMNADITIEYGLSTMDFAEPVGDIVVKTSALKAVYVKAVEIPSLIDELPILMVAACCAKGESVFEGVEELRVKETDRIHSMVLNLRKMGAKIKVMKLKGRECIVIEGAQPLKGARVKSFGDHRTAMSLIIAGLASKGGVSIDNSSCINKSFPDFLKILKKMSLRTNNPL